MQIVAPRRLPVRLLAGLAFAVLVWAFAGPLYDRAVTSVANAILRATETPAVTQLIWSDEGAVVNRVDFPRGSPRPLIRVTDLTFNFILLTVLFAVAARPLSNANVGRYLMAACALFPVHVLALIAQVKSIYALQLGPWSLAHYGVWARNVWGTLAHFYAIAGVHAAAVALWLLFSAPGVWQFGETHKATAGKRRER